MAVNLECPEYTYIAADQSPREYQPAYMLAKNQLFVPVSKQDIAIVRAIDERELNKAVQWISETAWSIAFPENLVEEAQNALKACVKRQRLWISATYEILPATCMYVVAMRARIADVVLLQKLRDLIGASTRTASRLVFKVFQVMLGVDVQSAIARFMPGFVKMRQGLAGRSKLLGAIVLELSMTMQTKNIYDHYEDFHLPWLDILACCFYLVFEANNLSIPFYKVCDVLGINLPARTGFDMDHLLEEWDGNHVEWSFAHATRESRRKRKLLLRKRLLAGKYAESIDGIILKAFSRP